MAKKNATIPSYNHTSSFSVLLLTAFLANMKHSSGIKTQSNLRGFFQKNTTRAPNLTKNAVKSLKTLCSDIIEISKSSSEAIRKEHIQDASAEIVLLAEDATSQQPSGICAPQKSKPTRWYSFQDGWMNPSNDPYYLWLTRKPV